MGVDLYIGSIPRYLTGGWETPMQTFARANGIKYNRVGPPPLRISLDSAQTATQAFAQNIDPKLGGIHPLDASDQSPYAALQLTQQGLDALVLSAAHTARPDLPMPRRLPTDVQSWPAVAESSDRQYYLGPMAVFESHIIVVGDAQRICGADGLLGGNVFVTTTAALDYAIGELLAYLAIDRQILTKRVAKGPPEAGAVLEQTETAWERTADVHHLDDVRAHALWGLACFDEARRVAIKHNAVIIRDQ